MPKKNIEIGRTPNDGTGDNLKIVIAKVNENIDDIYAEKQDALVSGSSIKTINSTSILGSGNISVQPTLVSGTNIKTINGNSVLGSGDLTISGGGGSNSGVHALITLGSGSQTSSSMQGVSSGTGSNFISNRLLAYPFIPSKSFTSSNLQINVSSLGSGASCRIAVYTDLNGVPDTSIFISSDLDCSTNGLKTANASISFVAGTTYWLAFHGGTAASINHLLVSQMIPLRYSNINTGANYLFRNVTYSNGTPTSFGGSLTYIAANAPLILITRV
jgi:hypothetical protein